MSDDPPRRRRADNDRRRWSDDRLDDLADDVDDLKNTAEGLSLLPERVVGIRDLLVRVERQLDQTDQRSEQRNAEIRGDIKRIDKALLKERPDGTVEARKPGVNWPMILVVAGTITVPIIVALIAVAAR